MSGVVPVPKLQGRSIRMFLVDGTPSGLITAEIMNWTGHALSGPRSKLPELVRRPECGRTGIYFLVGTDPDNSVRPLVYIGESDDVGKRLKQHNQPEGKGGKDFWEKVCLITSKDQNLTKAHVRYLESQLIRIVRESGRCGLTNGNEPEFSLLPEADLADMAFFIEQIRTILPVLGMDFLRESITAKPATVNTTEARSPVFECSLPRHNLVARAQEVDGEFVVLEGSKARASWAGVPGSYQNLFEQLCADGILVEDGGKHRIFARGHAFSSPSAAAAVVSGRSANGRITWLVESSKQTYGDWQSKQVEDEPAVE